MTERFLLRGGCVLSLGTRTQNLRRGDVLIEDGRIAEVGTGVRARDAELVEAEDAIVMPGFVDTHRHAWTSLFRNLDELSRGPSSVIAVAGDHYAADDVYAATLVGLLGAAEAGITTVVDFADLRLEDDALDAALQAHSDAGLRTVFVHVARDGGEGPARAALRRLAERAGPMTTIAVGSVERAPADAERFATDRALARELGVRTYLHGDAETSKPGAVAELGARGLLGEDVTLVHRTDLDEADLGAIEASGTAVTLTPSSEMAGGLGSPPIQGLIDHDVRPGLGIDDERAAPGDLFAQMRAAISMQHATVFHRKLAGKAGLPKLMSTRDVIRSATSDGARAAGVNEVAGSIEPGKAADVIVLRTDRPNIWPINDPIGAVVWGMDTSNVHWVFAGGRPLMREGALVADVGRARELATAARERVSVAPDLPTRATARSER